MGEPWSSARSRGVALAVLAVGITVGPAILLAGGGMSSSYTDASGGLVPGGMERSDQPRLELLGASGVLPSLQAVSPELIASLTAPAAPSAGPAPPVTIPAVVADAYRRSEQVLAQQDPECGLRAPLLAGLGRVISDHARSGGLDARGRTIGPILGPRLDGSPGLAEIPDSDEGRLDGDTLWDRASGPMQIIPAVWQRVGADSDGDALADPHNVYDAALAAGRFLCEERLDLRRADDQVRAVFRYQRSQPFIRATMLWTRAYGGLSIPDAMVEGGPEMLPVLPPAESVTLSADVPPPPTRLPAGPTRPPSAVPGPGPSGDNSTPPRSDPPPAAPPRPGPAPAPPSSPDPEPPPQDPDPPPSDPDPPPSDGDPPTSDPPSQEPEPEPEPEPEQPTSPQPTTGAPESTDPPPTTV